MNSQREREISPEHLREMATAFQRSRVLLTAYELGVFSALGDGTKSAAEVASELGSDERATDRLMNALCALGLLRKKGGRFSNSAAAARYLVRGKPEYMAGLMHTVHLWDSWSTLTEAVRKGGTVSSPAIQEREDEWLEAFIAAMHERAKRNAATVVSLLDLSGVSRVLDVGGGSGAFAMAFVRARDGITATVFDLPKVIPLTRRYVSAEGLEDRVETVIGDYQVDELGTGYDLVFLSAIVHSNSVDQNRVLLRKCAGALNPGGQVVIQDFVMEADRTRPEFGTLFALNMLVATEAGDTFTEAEIRSWTEEAGLSQITRIDTDFRTTLMVGRKVER